MEKGTATFLKLSIVASLLWLQQPMAAPLTQTTATTPIRLGDVARRLSDQDVASLERALSASGKPWLLIGYAGQSKAFEFIDAYLPPQSAIPGIRRGSMIPLSRRAVDPAHPEEWVIMDSNNLQLGRTGSYAQVAMEGRTFEQLQRDDDPNQPFLVNGTFDDAELIRIAKFIRSSPVSPGPIETVVRQSQDTVRIGIRQGVNLWQFVTVRKQGAGWEITSIARGQA